MGMGGRILLGMNSQTFPVFFFSSILLRNIFKLQGVTTTVWCTQYLFHLSCTQLSPITSSSRVSKSNLKQDKDTLIHMMSLFFNNLSSLPDKAGVSRRLHSVDKHLKIFNNITKYKSQLYAVCNPLIFIH